MCDHCDKKLCLTRKYGIRGQSLFPDLSDLQKINLDEPYYYVNVDGERVKLKDTSYLQEQRLFQRAVMEYVNKVPPTLRKKDFVSERKMNKFSKFLICFITDSLFSGTSSINVSSTKDRKSVV